MNGASPDRALAAAAAMLRGGRLLEAEQMCQQLLSGEPDNASVHQLAALVAVGRGNSAGALAHAIASLQLRPDHAGTLLIAGKAAKAIGDYPAAQAYLHRASEAAPELPESAFLLCIGQLEAGDASAQASLAALLERFPDDARGWTALGGALEKSGKFDAAIAAFQRAARAEPAAPLHLHMGTLLRKLGRFEPSACELRRAIALSPEAAPAWFALGVTEQDSGNHAAAIDAYRRALQLDPALAEAAVNLGICLQHNGALAAAKQAYGRALQLRANTFGRISQALTMAPKGELWLDLKALRAALLANGRAAGAEALAIDAGR